MKLFIGLAEFYRVKVLFFPTFPSGQPKIFYSKIPFDNSFCLRAHPSQPWCVEMSDTKIYKALHSLPS